MLEFLVGAIQGIIGMIKGVLPLSPFQDMTIPEGVGTALGWLNWVLPVSDCLAWFAVWLALLIAVMVFRSLRGLWDSIFGAVTGGE